MSHFHAAGLQAWTPRIHVDTLREGGGHAVAERVGMTRPSAIA